MFPNLTEIDNFSMILKTLGKLIVFFAHTASKCANISLVGCCILDSKIQQLTNYDMRYHILLNM